MIDSRALGPQALSVHGHKFRSITKQSQTTNMHRFYGCILLVSACFERSDGFFGPRTVSYLRRDAAFRDRPTDITRIATMSHSRADHHNHWDNGPKPLLPSKREQKREAKRNARIAKRAQHRLKSRQLPEVTNNETTSKASKSTTPTAVARRRRAAEANAAWLAKAQIGPTILIDCSWEANMSQREVRSLVQQIKLCYGTNRASSRPARLVLTSVSGEILRGLAELSGWGNWLGVHATSAPLESLLDQCTTGANRLDSGESPGISECTVAPIPAKIKYLLQTDDVQLPRLQTSRVVYLTADSGTDLCPHDEPLPWNAENTYVIGGIVKGAGLRRAAIARADSLGLNTARLPLDHFLSEKRSGSLRNTDGLAETQGSFGTLGNNEVVSPVALGGTLTKTSQEAAAAVKSLDVSEGFRSTFTVNRVCELLLLKAVNDVGSYGTSSCSDGDGSRPGSWTAALALVIPNRYRC